jgi:hypothetical protein
VTAAAGSLVVFDAGGSGVEVAPLGEAGCSLAAARHEARAGLTPRQRDVAKARQLLADAGHKEGLKLKAA